MDPSLTVVVTGGQGFIGSRLIERLRRENIPVLGVDLRPSGDLPNHHTTDLKDPETLVPESLAGRPFALVHLAWDVARTPRFEVHAEHVMLLAALLDYWSERGLTSLIGAGSAEEYGQRAGTIGEEDSPVGPLSPYGWGKRSAGRMVEAWSARTGIPAVWLRPFVVYGPGQTGDMVIPYATRLAMAGEPGEFTDAEQKRDFVYVDDLVEAILSALGLRAEGFAPVNVGTGRPVRLRDVLERIEEVFHADGLFNFGAIPRRPDEPEIQVARLDRAESFLNWRAQTTWEQGVDRLYRSLTSSIGNG